MRLERPCIKHKRAGAVRKQPFLEALLHIHVAGSGHLAGARMKYFQASPRNDALPVHGEMNSSLTSGSNAAARLFQDASSKSCSRPLRG
jgi:hypothetical protein